MRAAGRARPVQVCHEGNTAVHAAKYEGRPERRPLTRAELQAFLDAADDHVDRASSSRRKGWLAAFRDATLFKVIYRWGLRRREIVMLDTADFAPNPTPISACAPGGSPPSGTGMSPPRAGGHFAAFEQPDLFASEARSVFRTRPMTRHQALTRTPWWQSVVYQVRRRAAAPPRPGPPRRGQPGSCPCRQGISRTYGQRWNC